MDTAPGHDTTTDEVISGISMAGKTVVITGGSAGLGVETGRVLAGAGADVIMVGRDEARLSAAVASILVEFPAASISCETMDLADLASVRAAERLWTLSETLVEESFNLSGTQ